MKWRLWLVVVLLGASCAAPEPPEAWSVERLTPLDEVEETSDVCLDVRALALGSRAGETDLDGTLADLARLAATTGATAALPLLSDFGDLAADSSGSGAERSPEEIAIRQHDLLVEAARSIDDRTAETCEVPVFSALYAATGFAECHFEMELPIAAYTDPVTTSRCTMEGRPAYLPCWSQDGEHLAIDCVSGEIVQATDDRWAPAGEPRDVSIDRTVPDAPEGPEVVAPIETPACTNLAALFVDEPSIEAVLDRLVSAAAPLGDGVRDSADRFVAAAADPPSLDEFEQVVRELDEATVAACGLPVVSAWATLTPPVDDLPCWTPTGAPYPAYEITDCT